MQSINDAQLPLTDLGALGSDGPNANKAVFQYISEAKKSEHLPALMNIGFCNRHVVNNAFRKALQELGDDVVDLVVDLYYFFSKKQIAESLENELG